MKFYLVFVAVIAQTIAGPIENSQLLQVVSAAIEDPKTNPAVVPYFKDALNRILDSINKGKELDVYMTPEIHDYPVKYNHDVSPSDKTPGTKVASNFLVKVKSNSNEEERALNNPSPGRSPKVNSKKSTYMVVIGDLIEIPEDKKGHMFPPPTKLEESNFADDSDGI